MSNPPSPVVQPQPKGAQVGVLVLASLSSLTIECMAVFAAVLFGASLLVCVLAVVGPAGIGAAIIGTMYLQYRRLK